MPKNERQFGNMTEVRKAQQTASAVQEPMPADGVTGRIRAAMSLDAAQLLALSHEAVIGIKDTGEIVLWNRGAERLYGWTEAEALGRRPSDLLKSELPRPLPQIENILRSEDHWDGEVVNRTREGKQVTVSSRWTFWRDSAGRQIGRLRFDLDLTKRRKAEQDLRALSGRMLNLRDEERRRIARDLHDSAGQLLALTKVNLSAARRCMKQTDAAFSNVGEAMDMVEQALAEIRTISYLLHPPLLEELGLPSILPWYVQGFSQRSHIQVDLELAPNLGRLSHELETTIFRTVQECLTNVHRHSGSSTARVEITRSKNELRLKVEDQGRGMPDSAANGAAERALPSVGINGIRERVRQFGGQMQIRSGDWGTAVEAQFPLESRDIFVP